MYTFVYILHFVGFRTANCAYKAIGRPYIFEVNNCMCTILKNNL